MLRGWCGAVRAALTTYNIPHPADTSDAPEAKRRSSSEKWAKVVAAAVQKQEEQKWHTQRAAATAGGKERKNLSIEMIDRDMACRQKSITAK